MDSPEISLLDVLKQEREWIEDSRRARLGRLPKMSTDQNLVGLSFSGGGIRSATFNLGVIQGLAESSLFHKVDMISTVSGGGYIGSWLLGWMKHQNIGANEVQARLNARPESAANHSEPPEIRFLRNYSNYLTPRTGLFSGDFWTLVAVYLRNMFLNLLILSLLFLSLLLLPRAVVWLVHLFEVAEARHWFGSALAQWSAAVVGLFFGFVATIFIGYNIAWLEPPPTLSKNSQNKKFYAKPWGVHLFVILPLFLAAIFLSFAAIFIYAYYPIGWEDSFFAPALQFVIDLVNLILGKFCLTWHTEFLGPVLGFAIFFSQWVVACLFRWMVLRWNILRKKVYPTDGPRPSQLIVHAILAGTLAGVLFIPFIHLLTLGQVDPCQPGNKWIVLTFAPPAMIGIMLVAGTLHIGLLGRNMGDSHREWWAKLGAYLFLAAIAWLILFWIAIIFPPTLAEFIHFNPKWTFTGVLTWIASTTYGVLFGKSEKTSRWIPDLPFKQKIPGYLARITPYIFILGLLLCFSLLGACLDSYFLGHGWTILNSPDDESFGPRTSILLLCCCGAVVYLSWRVDVNQFSIHNLYRNRLVRCYLGASVPNRASQLWTGFSKLDDFPLDAIRPATMPDAKESPERVPDGRPFPIYNTCLNVVRGEELALQMRKARSFLLTPLFSGFTWPDKRSLIVASEFAETCMAGPKEERQFGETTLKNVKKTEKVSVREADGPSGKSGITIGTSMAISGAAASPNMGHYSDPGIGFLMTIFDVRLGWWIGNPKDHNSWVKGSPHFGLGWIIRELLGLTTDQSEFVYLSDGGHFENLGLYELVRRRCRLIIVSDSGQDPDYSCADLRQAIERCRVDFGVNIDIDLSGFLPQQNPPQPPKHFLSGKIHYPPSSNSNHVGPQDADLIVLKPNVVPGDPVDVAGYCKTNPHFPHDSTVNQWYDEAHFENYRALGQITARSASAAIAPAMSKILT